MVTSLKHVQLRRCTVYDKVATMTLITEKDIADYLKYTTLIFDQLLHSLYEFQEGGQLLMDLSIYIYTSQCSQIAIILFRSSGKFIRKIHINSKNPKSHPTKRQSII